MRRASEGSCTGGSAGSSSWVDDELSGGQFADVRHGTRLHSILQSMADDIGKPIPVACDDWANTKAAYRLLSNDRVTDKEILSGHFEATRGRMSAAKGPLLILHDTTEFVFKRGDGLAVGWPRKQPGGSGPGRIAVRLHTKYSVFMHSSLVVTPTGLPLGLAAAKLWTRPEVTPRKALSEREYKALSPEKKESFRWFENVRDATDLLGSPERCVHVADREADILALYHFAEQSGTRFLVRASYNRYTFETGETVDQLITKTPLAGTHRVSFKDTKGKVRVVPLEIKFCRAKLVRSRGKPRDLPPVEVTMIYAYENTKPQGQPKLEWKLVTNLEVNTLEQAIEKIDWYAMRWKIETFHKILKSGCKVEDSKLRTTPRLTNLIAVSCILAWRIFWMTMINRSGTSLPSHLVLTEFECRVLDRRIKDKNAVKQRDVAHYVNKIARLGGYLNRANDPPPGNTIMWRGITKLSEIVIGAEIGAELVGN